MKVEPRLLARCDGAGGKVEGHVTTVLPNDGALRETFARRDRAQPIHR
jgi:hypothetical protein